MEGIRKPLQGITNIIRFNWTYFAISYGLLVVFFIFRPMMPIWLEALGWWLAYKVVVINTVALLASFYIYDVSSLYKLTWLEKLDIPKAGEMINLNAGFDETSFLLDAYFPSVTLKALDFYDEDKHTESSIKRAQKFSMDFPNSLNVTTDNLQIPDKSVDVAFALLSAHEIRKTPERITFFKEIKRVLKDDGRIVVTEHLRDIPNFLGYNIGFFHFLFKHTWLKTFKGAGLKVVQKTKVTPFITNFVLAKNGNPS